MRQLLLLSNSRDSAGRFLYHAMDAMSAHLHGVRRVLFVPFANVSGDFDGYTRLVQQALDALGVEVQSVHEASDPSGMVRDAEGIIVGGGNTFRLLASVQERGLLASLRESAMAGTPYVGWSAGSVLACPTLKTTNDMPVVEPESFAALGLVSFQINAHFTDAHPPGFQGETRRQRLEEFLVANPHVSVMALPEGDWLQVAGTHIRLRGAHTAPVFRHGEAPVDCAPGSSIHHLLEPQGANASGNTLTRTASP